MNKEPSANPPANWQENVLETARRLRLRAVETAVRLNGCYLGQVCSAAEILAVLFGRHYDARSNDLVILSPAHYCLALYAIMAERGELSEEAFLSYNEDGSPVEMIGGFGAPGMPFTTGSLAQGFSQGIGVAMARERLGKPGRIFVYLSDGEMQEGQTWEAFMTYGYRKPKNMTIVIDVNHSQVDGNPKDILDIHPLPEKLRAFNLGVSEVDGHDVDALDAAFTTAATSEQPHVIVATTNISQGVPSISNRHNLHFVRFRAGEAETALADLQQA